MQYIVFNYNSQLSEFFMHSVFHAYILFYSVMLYHHFVLYRLSYLGASKSSAVNVDFDLVFSHAGGVDPCGSHLSHRSYQNRTDARCTGVQSARCQCSR